MKSYKCVNTKCQNEGVRKNYMETEVKPQMACPSCGKVMKPVKSDTNASWQAPKKVNYEEDGDILFAA